MDLFVQQARLVRRGFEVDDTNRDDVLAICRGLDCLPLALSLAAARLRLLTPERCASDWATSLTYTDMRRPDRQRTLRVTIAWSYGLLRRQTRPSSAGWRSSRAGRASRPWNISRPSRRGPDGFAALEALAEASLVEVREDDAGESRVHLLNTTRAFALGALEEVGELDAAYASMARWCRDLLEDPARYTSKSPAQWAETVRIRAELDNLRAASQWLVDDRVAAPADDLVDVALAIVGNYHRHSRGCGARRGTGLVRRRDRWVDEAPR